MRPLSSLARIFHQGRAHAAVQGRAEVVETAAAKAHRPWRGVEAASGRPGTVPWVRGARYKLDWVLEAAEASIHVVLRGIGKRPGEICGLVQATLTVVLSLIAALTLTLLASSAFAHTGADGGNHHDLLNMAHHLTELQDWLAQRQLEVWVLLPPALAVCAWLTLRWFHKKSKRAASSARPTQHTDQP